MPSSSQLDLQAAYLPLIGARLNIAVSETGSVAGSSGDSNSVSNPLDRALLRHLRSISDVIVTSGATARAEKLRPSVYAPIVVLTESDSAEGYASLHVSRSDVLDVSPVILLTTLNNSQALAASVELYKFGFEVCSVASDKLSPAAVLGWLQAQPFENILLEFGPTLAKLWSQARAIDELCLTETGVHSPLIRNPRPPAFVVGDWRLEHDLFIDEFSSRFSRFSRLESL